MPSFTRISSCVPGCPMQLTKTSGHAWHLLLLMFGLEIMDAVITHFLVGVGYVQEGNPLMASIVSEGDFILLKITGILVCLPLLLILYKRFPRLATVTMSSIIAFYGMVISWNLTVVLVA